MKNKSTFAHIIRTVLALLIVATACGAISCTGSSALKTPRSLSVDEGVLSWIGDSNAQSYSLQIDDDDPIEGIENTYYNLGLTAARTYYLKVKAVGGSRYSDSDWSQQLTYVHTIAVDISFVSYSDDEFDTITRQTSSPYGSLPSGLTRYGYVFAGWYTEEGGTGKPVISTTTVSISTNHSLYAKWNPVSNIAVTLEHNGGTSDTASINVTYDSHYSGLPTEVARYGYVFGGWWIDPDCAKTQITSQDRVDNMYSHTLYAKWTAVSGIVVSFELGGGSGTASQIEVAFNQFYGTLPSEIQKQGYTFAGWYTELGGAGRLITSESRVENAGNHTLYAKWTTLTMQVEFEGYDCNETLSPVTVSYGGAYGSLPQPTKYGFEFAGWFTGEGGSGTQIQSSTIVSSLTAHTLYARWQRLSVAVSFYVDGGQELSGVEVEYGQPYGVLPTTTKYGHTFDGWYLEQDKQNLVSSATVVQNAQAHTLYAGWKLKDDIWVSFEAGAGTASGAGKNVTYTHAYGALPTATQTGYTFVGWYTGEGGTGAEVTAETAVTSGADHTLYAWYKAKTYTVTLDANGGTGGTTVTATFGEDMPTPAQAPEHGDVSFIGYFSSTAGGDKYYYADLTSAKKWDIDSNATLYAVWQNMIRLSTAEHLIDFAEQVNDGNNFEGWYVDLANDIDLGGMEWTPIGTDNTTNFEGEFDGNNYTISNYVITKYHFYVGLFGFSNGNIKNLKVKDYLYDFAYDGTVYAGGIMGYNAEVVTNCSAEGQMKLDVSSANVGGICGLNNSAGMVGCYANVDVYVKTKSSPFVGGIVGGNYTFPITNCTAVGKIYIDSSYGANVGGIAGYVYSEANISSCSTEMEIIAFCNRDVNIGGIAGRATMAHITDCTSELAATVAATVNDYASVYAGGIVGQADSEYASVADCEATVYMYAEARCTASVGGIVGYNCGTVSQCSATGSLTAKSILYDCMVGGLIGYNESDVSDCSADVKVVGHSHEGVASVGGLIGKSTEFSTFPTISNCHASGDVSAYTYANNAYIGGLIGMFSGAVYATNCYATGDVSTDERSYAVLAGGLIGGSAGGIAQCYAEGNVDVEAMYSAKAGGLIGYNLSAEVSKSYATGNVKALSAINDNNYGAFAGGLIGESSSKKISLSYASGQVEAEGRYIAYAGGLVGYANGGKIDGCYSTAAVQAKADFMSVAGGLVGYFKGTSATIVKSFASGNVGAYGDGTIYSGGLVGYAIEGKIENCYASGSVAVSSTFHTSYAGGLAGYTIVDISYSYASGDVTSRSAYSAYAGGLLGFHDGNTILGCLATGNVEAVGKTYGGRAGGLLGYNNGTITSNYRYNEQIVVGDINYNGTACTEDDLNTATFYTATLGFDPGIWSLSPLDFQNKILPTLR